MLRNELRQARMDFSLAPELAREHCEHAPHDEATTFIRVLSGVTHYLSRIATGEARIYEGHLYGALGVRIDEITDEQRDEIPKETARRALDGEHDDPTLDIFELTSAAARSPGFDEALLCVVEQQNRSLEQFEDPGEPETRGIVMDKGGASGIAHVHLIKEEVTPSDEGAAYLWGALMQLLDDYLDQPDDAADGISTVFTEGYMDAAELERIRRDALNRIEATWGYSPGMRRFRTITRLHRYAGMMRNRTPLEPSWVCPWYL